MESVYIRIGFPGSKLKGVNLLMRHSKLSLLLFIFSIFFTPLCCSAAESEDFQMQNEDFKEAVLPLSFAHGRIQLDNRILKYTIGDDDIHYSRCWRRL